MSARRARLARGLGDAAPWLAGGGLGAAWAGFFLHYGLRLSGDSTAYTWYALQAHAHGELTVAATWPPLYPLALAGLMYLTPFPSEAAALLAGLCILGFAGATGALARLLGASGPVAGLVALLVGTWPAVLQVFDVAWSEQLYAACFALHVLFLARFWRHDRTVDLAAAAGWVSLLCLSRYAGYSQLGIFGLLGLWCVWRRPRARLRRLGLLALTPVPSALYLVRNQLVWGTVHGEREPGEIPLSTNLELMAGILTEDLPSLPLLLALPGAVLLLAVASRRPREHRDHLVILGYIVVALLTQVGLTLYATSTVKMDGLNPRFVAPLYPLLVGAGALGLGMLCRRRATHALLLAGLASLVGLQSPAFLDHYRAVGESRGAVQGHTGFGFSASRTAADLRQVVHARLERAEGLAMGAIVKARNGRNGRALFVRGASVLGPEVSRARFVRSDVHHAVLSLRVGGVDKELRGISMPSMTRADQLIAAIERAWDYAEGLPLLLVIHPKGLQRELGHSRLEPLVEGHVLVRRIAEPAPYDVYEVGGFPEG